MKKLNLPGLMILSLVTISMPILSQAAKKPEAKPLAKTETQKIELTVTENGFEPKEIHAKAGAHLILQVTRKTDSTCAREIQVPEKKVKKELPLGQMVTMDLGTVAKGIVPFGCGMNMMESGKIIVDP